MNHYRVRRLFTVVIVLIFIGLGMYNSELELSSLPITSSTAVQPSGDATLDGLAVKGRAPKTGYERQQFGDGWDSSLGCDTRNRILARDLVNVTYDAEGCKVQTGTLNDPYTGKIIQFVRGETTSDDVQIDHVVALSNAWQTGAQQLSYEQRVAFSNDPLNLLAVDGPTNEKKSDGDAATWLPPNKAFRCQYVKRQVSVKATYNLWVTPSEKEAMARGLHTC